MKIIIAKIVEHAWNDRKQDGNLKHRQEFIDKGIRTQAELRDIVAKGIEGKDTRAFRAQPSIEQGKAMSRELYEIRLVDNQKQPYELVVILNPDLKNGRLLGGTCFVPPDPVPPDPRYFDKQLKLDIDRLQANSPRKIPSENVLVVGGRPALREQDSHRQLSVPVAQKLESEPKRETLRDRLRREAAEQGRDIEVVLKPGLERRLERKLEIRKPRRPGDEDDRS